jgi:glycosyltransferase involved in cell wall biosynthesis
VPSFNQAAFLERTLISIVTQQYPRKEIIVIDGGSTDGSIGIIRKHEEYLRYWVSEKDNGQSHAINKGLKIASGDLVNWLNSDDTLAPDSLQILAEKYELNPKVKLFCGYCEYIDQHDKIVGNKIRARIWDSREKTIINHHYIQQSSFYSLDVFKKLKGVNQSLHYVMDIDIFIRFLLAHSHKDTLMIDATLANFRLHAQSKTQLNRERFWNELNAIYAVILRNSGAPKFLYTKLITGMNSIDLSAYKNARLGKRFVETWLKYLSERSIHEGKPFLDAFTNTFLLYILFPKYKYFKMLFKDVLFRF